MCFVFRGKKKKEKKAVIRPCHSGEFFLHASFRFRKIGDAAFASVRACVRGKPPGVRVPKVTSILHGKISESTQADSLVVFFEIRVARNLPLGFCR
jgi:hypothetical protein